MKSLNLQPYLFVHTATQAKKTTLQKPTKMFYVSKRMEISGSHRLNLSYESKCTNTHGHNWIITVFCRAEKLNKDGMVVDFTHVKKLIHGKLDHAHLNDVLPFNPTAENIAKWIADQIPECYKVSVQESEGNIAVYCKDPECPAPC